MNDASLPLFAQILTKSWSGRYGWGKTRGEDASRCARVAALLRGARRSCDAIGVAGSCCTRGARFGGLTVWSTGNDSGPTSVFTRLPGTPSPQDRECRCGSLARRSLPARTGGPGTLSLCRCSGGAARQGSFGTLRFPPRSPRRLRRVRSLRSLTARRCWVAQLTSSVRCQASGRGPTACAQSHAVGSTGRFGSSS